MRLATYLDVLNKKKVRREQLSDLPISKRKIGNIHSYTRSAGRGKMEAVMLSQQRGNPLPKKPNNINIDVYSKNVKPLIQPKAGKTKKHKEKKQ